MSLRLAAKSTTLRPFAFILPSVTFSCFMSSFLMRSSTSAEVAAPNVPTNWLMNVSGSLSRYRKSPKARSCTMSKSGSWNRNASCVPNFPSKMRSLGPAVWSDRGAPTKKNETGIMSSPRLDAGHRHRPVLPRGLETRDRLATRPQGGVEALRVGRVPDHRDDRGGLVERVEHRVVVFIQLVEFRLLDLDRRADAGVPAFRVTHLGLEALDREDDVADALEALDLSVHRQAVADVLEFPADALQLIRELDAEQVVRRADVLSPPVAGVAGDHQLDLLEQSSVLFDSVADIGHVRFLRAFRLMFCLDMYLRVWMEVRGRSAFHHRENPGRSPSITPPDEPSTRMNICFPLCAYSMNHTGACSNSPSYVVG